MLSLSLSLILCCVTERKEEEVEDLFRLEKLSDDDYCHGLFAFHIKRVGICLVGITLEIFDKQYKDNNTP